MPGFAYDRVHPRSRAAQVLDVIRFSCQHCGREYLLPDAMAHLPLLCKKCGQRLEVPDPQPDPPEPPPPPPVVRAPAPPRTEGTSGFRRDARQETLPLADAAELPEAEAPVAHAPASPTEAPSVNGDQFLSKDTLEKLDSPLEASSPPPGQAWGAPVLHKPVPVAPPAKAPVAHAVGSPKAEAPVAHARGSPASSRRGLGVVVDVVVAIILLGLGVLLGEFATRKSTREILEGVSGPKFPSVDLLVWLGGPALLLLIYAWLGTRGWTVGGWLRRRAT